MKKSLPCSTGQCKYSSLTYNQKKSVWERSCDVFSPLSCITCKKSCVCYLLICDGDSTIFPDNLFYCFTAFHLRSSSLQINLNLSCYSLSGLLFLLSYTFLMQLPKETIATSPLIWSLLNMTVQENYINLTCSVHSHYSPLSSSWCISWTECSALH